MIQLKRNRQAAVSGFRGASLRKKLQPVFKQQRQKVKGEIDKIKFQSSWGITKPQLEMECHSKCAYCEANTKVVAHGDVEHYRPKSIYWWLAYTYDNYLFSCQICNQSYKSNNFPIEGRLLKEPKVLANMTDEQLDELMKKYLIDPRKASSDNSIVGLKKLKREKPLLINPYIDDPANWFIWEYDDNEKVVRLKPKPDDDGTAAKFVKAAIDFYGLNREELEELRYKEFRIFRTLRRALPVLAGVPELWEDTKNTIEEMQQPHWVFSGMCRYFGSLPLEDLADTPMIENG